MAVKLLTIIDVTGLRISYSVWRICGDDNKSDKYWFILIYFQVASMSLSRVKIMFAQLYYPQMHQGQLIIKIKNTCIDI